MNTQSTANDMPKWRTNLQRYMDERQLTSKAVLMATGMHYKTIKQWREEGMDNLNADLVVSVCTLLKVEWHDLVYLDESEG